jgi:hypothetical protein
MYVYRPDLLFVNRLVFVCFVLLLYEEYVTIYFEILCSRIYNSTRLHNSMRSTMRKCRIIKINVDVCLLNL